jgi:selenide,water dikinase
VPTASLSVACFSPKLPAEVYRAILAGAAETARAAGAPIVGGHTIKDNEIKFGLAVIGEIHPDRILTKGGARAGDVLVLTKPLGTSALATALKRDVLTETDPAYAALVDSLTRLNDDASAVALEFGAHALTDITGFGLSGHGLEMALASGVTLQIEMSRLPVLPRALEVLAAGHTCGGTETNRMRALPHLDAAPGLDAALLHLLHDPQTSGPLLMALPAAQGDAAVTALHRRGLTQAARVGQVLARGATARRVLG